MPADAWAVIFARFGSKEAAEAKEAKEAPKAEAKAPAGSAPAAGDFRAMPADAWAAIFARFGAKDRGKRLHARVQKSEHPWENATDSHRKTRFCFNKTKTQH